MSSRPIDYEFANENSCDDYLYNSIFDNLMNKMLAFDVLFIHLQQPFWRVQIKSNTIFELQTR